MADPSFQALAPAAQEAARNAYFAQNVLPNIPKEANASAIRLKFDQDTQIKAPAAPAPPPQSGSDLASAQAGSLLRHPFTTGIGALENAVSAVTGGAGAVADAVTGSDPGTHNWAYQPRTQAGQEQAQIQQGAAAGIGRGYDAAFGTGPLAATLKERLPEAAAAVGTVAGAAGIPKAMAGESAAIPASAQEVVDRMAAASPQNQVAASAAPRLSSVSPELQQAVVSAAQKTGGAVNPEVLTRHVEADSLPVKINLTEGQATQDPVILSQEMNLRGKQPALAARFNEQNKQLVDNVQAIRDQIGPDVFSTNPAEHGDTLIEAYKAKDAAAQAQITAKYQALKDANGGQFPVDARALLDNATAQLHKDLLFDHAPRAVMNTLGRLADDGSMTFENYESLRTNLARIQRSFTADGNEKAAAGVIRNAMEQLPLSPGAAQLKPLADAARSAARTQFQALDADPAYKAAVNDSVPPDRFVDRYVINAPRDQLAVMRQNLATDPTATQTMSVAALDHLRKSARIDADWNGNFSQAGFNKGLQALGPKLNSLVDPKTAEQLSTLGNVARYTQFQPRGSFVNNSNTFVAGAADYSASALEGAANVAAGGVPVGTWARKSVQALSAGKAVRQATAPGAGLDRLNTSPAVQRMLEAARLKAAQQSGMQP